MESENKLMRYKREGG